MQITLDVPDEMAEAAKQRGLSVEAYAEQILREGIDHSIAGQQNARTAEEIRAWLDELAQFSDKIPPLPRHISREWFYQDHD